MQFTILFYFCRLMKYRVLTILFLYPAIWLNAQDRYLKELNKINSRQFKSLDSNGWSLNGNFILNLNQGALSNWAAGGEESVLGINGIFNYTINARENRITWDNVIDLAMGFQNATSFGKFRKIDDRIDVTSKTGYQISKKWYTGVLFNFNSQALVGYAYSDTSDTKISSFLTPGKILISPGFDYKPGSRFSFFISPVTIKWVLKNDQDFFNMAKFGVDSARKANTELGAYFTAIAKLPIAKWATFTSRLDLFSNYKRKPENIDLLMTNLLTMKFNKTLATNLSLDLIYDDDVIKRLQVKEILGVGLTVKL